MKKPVIFALCILCIIPFALTFAKDFIAKMKLPTEDRILYNSDKGIVLGDVRYKFQGLEEGEFSLNEYRTIHDYSMREKLRDIVIAKTPKEAAELGRQYMRVTGLEGNKDIFISVRYCSEIDSWVLVTEWDKPRPPSPGGIPSLLVISRVDGSMVIYHNPQV